MLSKISYSYQKELKEKNERLCLRILLRPQAKVVADHLFSCLFAVAAVVVARWEKVLPDEVLAAGYDKNYDE